MSDDLYEVLRDDHLIEAAARGDLMELEDDLAAGPLVALSLLADGAPLPKLDVDASALVDTHVSHRYAVRSLAAAVTVVATLSTSGVSAVVTGDPFRPAKAVWHQIQDHTGIRSDAAAQTHAGSALGVQAVQPKDADASKPYPVPAAPGPSPAAGLTARAPFRAQEPGDEATTSEPAQPSADPSAEESTQPQYSDDDTQPSDEQDQSQEPTEPTDPEQQQGDGSDSQPAPGEEQPAPDNGSDGDGLGDLISPGTPDQTQDQGTAQPLPMQRPLPEDVRTDREQVPGQQPGYPLSDAVQNTIDGAASGTSADESTADPTDPSAAATASPPPTLAP